MARFISLFDQESFLMIVSFCIFILLFLFIVCYNQIVANICDFLHFKRRGPPTGGENVFDYVVSDGNGVYIGKDQKNKPMYTTDVKQAIIFGSSTKAWNFVANLSRNFETSKLIVQQVGTGLDGANQTAEIEAATENELAESAGLSAPIQFGNIDSQYMIDLKANVRIMQDVFSKARAEYTAQNEEQRRLENQLLDLEHAAELKPNMSAVDGYKLYTQIRDVRRKRRECKDAKAILEMVLNSSLKDWEDGKVGLLLDSLDHRSYIPRDMPELFE
jgi:hypothetical protein